jgi:hypothetical protein
MRLVELLEHTKLREVCLNDPIEVKNITQKALNSSKDNPPEVLTNLIGVDETLAKKLIIILRSSLE